MNVSSKSNNIVPRMEPNNCQGRCLDQDYTTGSDESFVRTRECPCSVQCSPVQCPKCGKGEVEWVLNAKGGVCYRCADYEEPHPKPRSIQAPIPPPKIRRIDSYMVDTAVDTVPVARDNNGQPTMTNADGPFTCYVCKGALVYRRLHRRSRTSPTHTTVFDVCGHFVHFGPRQCHRESYQHKLAKELLLQRLPPLWIHCSNCGNRTVFDKLPADGDRVAEWTTENGRRLDVGILSSTGELCGAIEVWHSHACDDSKLVDLQDLVGDAWCEVRAADVISQAGQGGGVIVATCSAMACPGCCEGHAQQRETKLLATKAETAALQAEAAAIDEKCAAERAMRLANTRQRLIAMGGTPVIEFGRYSGVSVPALLSEDPTYVIWLAKGGTEDLHFVVPVDILKAARVLTKGLCKLCAVPVDGPAWKTLCTDCYRLRNS